MKNTIQTIKEAEERLKKNFKRDNTGEKVEGYLLYPSVIHNTEQYVKIATQNDIIQEVRQTLLAVFESELESVPEDETDGSKLGYENSPEIYGNQRLEAMKKGINQERARQRSHLTEVINYLKQK